MPQTINGIGTWYYGKKDVHTQRGVCDHCHQAVDLQSYETRLWFVVLFIPVIPLGRKQILDKCPKCSWHRAVPLAEWERLKQEGIQEAGEQAAKAPTDPEAAMELHGALVAFQQHDKAKAFAEIMARKFADNYNVQFHLGSWHEVEGRDPEADACFERALELEPDNPAARRAVGIGCIQRGDFDRARELLGPMLQPGEHQDPGVLLLLAHAHQDRGEHEQALALYEAAIQAAPGLGRDKKLRKRVQASEQALHKPTSALPKLPVSRALIVVAALGALAVAAFVLIGFLLASRQTLYIVNHLSAPVRVAIDRGPPLPLGARSRLRVVLSEGEHQALIRRDNAPDETVDFAIRNGLLQRWARTSVFVLNVAGAADLLWEENIYTAAPATGATRPYRIHFAEKFLTFRNIDYPFRHFPKELRSESSRVTKRRVSVLDAEPAGVLAGFPDNTPPDELLRYAEHHLALCPDDAALLEAAGLVAAGHKRLDRLRDFLAGGLDRRPVAVDWHRMYQELCKTTGGAESLPALYDQMLAKEPRSSPLLYLRGRIARRSGEAMRCYGQAIAADPANSYPWFAQSYLLVAKGDLAAARKPCAEACRLKPDDAKMASHFFDIRLGLGEHGALEAELRRKLQHAPLHFGHHTCLLRALVAAGKPQQARKAHHAFARAIARGTPQDPAQLSIHSQLVLYYLQGDMAHYLDVSRALKDPRLAAQTALVAHVERGDLAEAETSLRAQPEQQTGYMSLLMSIAWQLKGDAGKAATWRERAARELAAGRPEDKRLAALLASGDDVPLDEVDEAAHIRPIKAALLVALAAQCPARRADLLARAQALNVLDTFPYHLLERAIDAMKK